MVGVVIINKASPTNVRVKFIPKDGQRCSAKTSTGKPCQGWVALDGLCMSHFNMNRGWSSIKDSMKRREERRR